MVIETYEDMNARALVIITATVAVERLADAVLLKGLEFGNRVDSDVRDLIRRGQPGG